MVTSGGFIQACEQEQLHLSGAIQSYGALLIANKRLFRSLIYQPILAILLVVLMSIRWAIWYQKF